MPERVAHLLLDYSAEVRRAAYASSSPVVEMDLLKLSRKMAADANAWINHHPARRSRLPQEPALTE